MELSQRKRKENAGQGEFLSKHHISDGK